MHRFAGLDGDRLRPQLAGSAARAARSARPVPAPASLRRVEPLAAVFLGLHGVMVLAGLGGDPWQWAGVGLVLICGLPGLGGRGPAWLVPVRGLVILAVGVALQATAGGAAGWFAAWPFVLVAVYPLALPGPGGLVVAGLAVLGYVLVVRLAGPPAGPALAVARGVLLAGLAALALTATRAYARMANLAVEASWSWAGANGWTGLCWMPWPTRPRCWTPRGGSWPSTRPGPGARPRARPARPSAGSARATRPPARPRPPPATTAWPPPPTGSGRSWPARGPCSAAATSLPAGSGPTRSP